MIKKLLITLSVIIGLLVIAVVVFLLTFDLNHYRQFAMEQASKILGRPVEIQSLSTKLSLVPTIKVEGVRILDPNQKEPVLEIPKLEAVIDLPPLVHRQIFIQKIIVPSATLVWRGTKDSPKETSPNADVPALPTSTNNQQVWIEAITVNTLNCTIGEKKPYEFIINKVNLKNMSKFTFEVVYLKNTVSVSGNFGSILELFSKENLPVELNLTQGRTNLRINGSINNLKNVKNMRFQIDGDTPSLSGFLQNWGIQHAKIPPSNLTLSTSLTGDLEKAKLGETKIMIGRSEFSLTTSGGTLNNLSTRPTVKFDANISLKKGDIASLWGINGLDVTTKVTASPSLLSLANISLNAGKSDLKGKLRLSAKEKMVSVQANIESIYFDIHDVCAPQKSTSDKKGTNTQSAKIFNDDKLPFALLKNIDADITVDVEHLKFAEKASDYAAINGTISVKQNVLKSDMRVKTLDGLINNQMTVNANRREVSTTIQARNIRLEKIKALEKSIRGSQADADISLSASGDTLRQLANTTNGRILMELSGGEIINKEFNSLPTTLNILKGKNNSLSFSTQDQKTQLLCGAMNIPVQDGIATSNNQIALETDTLNFIVDGQVNLKNETINLSMIPSVSKTRGMANELLALGQSVQLTGSLSDIKIGVNPLKATDTLVQVVNQKLSGTKTQNAAVDPTSLCQKVLGRPLSKNKKGNTTQNNVSKPKNTSTTTVPQQQQNLKQKLVQSLSQALSNQVTGQQ